ncbi:MAG: IPT/TIG domain-containing protein [Actinobacteria bacterium]|nr:IPT/TIG domain-containing protein [Actinomycetota bacterium]
MHRFRVLAGLTFAFAVLTVAPAGAAIVTVGSPMTGNYSSLEIGLSFAVFNTHVPGNNVSPVNGAVVGWNIEGASGGPFTLRVIRPVNATEYVGGGHSAPASPLTTAFQHFSADVPIKAGEMVAFDHANPSDHIGIGSPLLSTNKLGFFNPALAEGATGTATSTTSVEAAFNAEVQPEPTVTGLGTSGGPTGGGTSVLIAGTDLENTVGVSFGGSPASFGQVTEGSVVATSPPGSAGPVTVTVTTLAGSATAGQPFTYQASAPAPTPGPSSTPPPTSTAKSPVKCKVPNLLGQTLRSAKAKLAAAHCKLGKVTKRQEPKGKVGKVVKQGAKPNSSLAGNAAVPVTVGKAS